MLHVALVGAGNMGFAMLRGWTALEGYTFSVAEPNADLLARARDAGAKDLSATRAAVDVLVIATKPQVAAQVAAQHQHRLAPDGLIVSIAAGISIDAIAAQLDRPCAIIRAMPNTPAAIGQGMIVCCPNAQAQDVRYRNIAQSLLSASGRVAFVQDEALMDAVTAVSGSGPAYVFHFIEALHTAAVAAGLDDELAMQLAKQTVFGAARLAVDSLESPATLREQVTSPKGTTAAALSVLMAQPGGLQDLLKAAVAAARDRSIALGRAAG